MGGGATKNGLFGRRLRGYVCAQMILTNCALTFSSEDIAPLSVEAMEYYVRLAPSGGKGRSK